MIFLNCLIKSPIHKIKEHEIFQNFLTSTHRQNRKKNVQNNKKIKKTNSKPRNFRKKIISHIYIFYKNF